MEEVSETDHDDVIDDNQTLVETRTATCHQTAQNIHQLAKPTPQVSIGIVSDTDVSILSVRKYNQNILEFEIDYLNISFGVNTNGKNISDILLGMIYGDERN